MRLDNFLNSGYCRSLYDLLHKEQEIYEVVIHTIFFTQVRIPAFMIYGLKDCSSDFFISLDTYIGFPEILLNLII